jgi:hypothetical protein
MAVHRTSFRIPIVVATKTIPADTTNRRVTCAIAGQLIIHAANDDVAPGILRPANMAL